MKSKAKVGAVLLAWPFFVFVFCEATVLAGIDLLACFLSICFVQTGYLVPPGDEEAFADRVSKLLDDTALRMSMSKAGREETEKWSWEAATSVLRNVQYKKVKGFQVFVW